MAVVMVIMVVMVTTMVMVILMEMVTMMVLDVFCSTPFLISVFSIKTLPFAPWK